jgi:uncharacterized protein
MLGTGRMFMENINIRYFKRPDLTGGVVIDGFPNVGLIGSIIANFLIEEMELDQVAAIDSPDFPPVSMIYANKPKFPARMYASDKHKMVVVLSEFTPSPEMARPIAKALLAWANEQHCEYIISPGGIPVLDDTLDTKRKHTHKVFGVGSSTRARNHLGESNIPPLGSGMVTGVPGILLNEGRWANFPVIALLVEIQKAGIEADPCLEVLKIIKKLVPKCDFNPSGAKPRLNKIIERIGVLRHQAMPAQEGHEGTLMYTFDL